jgi:hypothetical protein
MCVRDPRRDTRRLQQRLAAKYERQRHDPHHGPAAVGRGDAARAPVAIALEVGDPGETGIARSRRGRQRVVPPAHEGRTDRIPEAFDVKRSWAVLQDRLAEIQRHVRVVGPIPELNRAGADARPADEFQRRAEAVAAGMGEKGSTGVVSGDCQVAMRGHEFSPGISPV